ncbi:hypothetical protein [Bacillus sp. 1021]|nr:hypothetical protein [Bacillus sp. 1021]
MWCNKNGYRNKEEKNSGKAGKAVMIEAKERRHEMTAIGDMHQT